MKSTAIIVCLSIILYAGLASAEETKAGFIKSASGKAFIIRQKTATPAKAGDKLLESDILRTGPDGAIGVIFQDNSVLGIGSNTQVHISQFVFEPANKKMAFLVKVKKGSLVYLTGLIAKLGNDSVKFETPSSICGVRGTHLAIKVDDEEGKVLPGRDIFSSEKNQEQ